MNGYVSDEQAAAGSRSLKFQDSKLPKAHFDPHLHYSPNFDNGLLRMSFDFYRGADAQPGLEWRDWLGGPIKSGPSIAVNAEGVLMAKNVELCPIPCDTWVHVEITCQLGKARTGTYELVVTVPGEEPQSWPELACGYRRFSKVNWLGITSNAMADTVFYIDNLRLGLVRP